MKGASINRPLCSFEALFFSAYSVSAELLAHRGGKIRVRVVENTLFFIFYLNGHLARAST